MSREGTDSSETQGLLKRIRNGEREAFDLLFARHRLFIRQMIQWRMDPALRQRVDASDLVQEAHMEAARRLPGFLVDPRMPFKLWLRQIAYDRVLMTRRRHLEAGKRSMGRELCLPDETSLQLAHRVMSMGPSPSQAVMQGELAAQVRSALARLSETDREVLVMRLLEGLSNGEIALALQLEPAAVSKRYGRALLRLRALLHDPGATDTPGHE